MTAVCDVQLITYRRRCLAAPARSFTAACACGHPVGGFACEGCLLCVTPGCLTCWLGPRPHPCPVEFLSAECVCGCGKPVPVAPRTRADRGQVKGRPVRYATHGRQLEVVAV